MFKPALNHHSNVTCQQGKVWTLRPGTLWFLQRSNCPGQKQFLHSGSQVFGSRVVPSLGQGLAFVTQTQLWSLLCLWNRPHQGVDSLSVSAQIPS